MLQTEDGFPNTGKWKADQTFTRGALLVAVHAPIVKPTGCLLKQRIYPRFFQSCGDNFSLI